MDECLMVLYALVVCLAWGMCLGLDAWSRRQP